MSPVRLILLWLALVLPVAVPAGHAASPSLDWFRVDPPVLTHWSVARDPDHPARATITPKEWDQGRDPYHVMILLPKPSSTYNASVSKTLEIFHEHDVPAIFTVVNFGNHPALGAEAVAWAEATDQDLIMSIGSLSTAYLHETYRGGRLPVVAVASKDPVLMGQMSDYEQGSGTNIAYTSINMPVATLVTYLKQIKPDLRNLAVLYDRRNTSAVITQVEPLRALARSGGFNLIEVVVDGAANAVADLKREMPVALTAMRQNDPTLEESLFLISGSTAVYSNIATVNRLAGRVPVVSILPNVVQEGEDSAVLAIGVDERTNAHLGAIYALDVLQGRAEPGEMPVGQVTPPDIAINFLVARHIGLKVPFSFFESATFIYDYDGRAVREFGQNVDLGS